MTTPMKLLQAQVAGIPRKIIDYHLDERSIASPILNADINSMYAIICLGRIAIG